ncbi:hypothetical protein E1301_Tti024036 [Triplophysa tibetana]|uniref:Uncharacterized protein n=1 Tax=Triplophysa tibetana TaxID=1572043 RepID=A0A5A9PIF0_9TELE|nr:hypothetical protein E1301_Tti024036 [Triplophysa tibetana]
MTMRKFSRYPGCQVEAIRKCCSACYASLSKSKKTEAFKDRLDNEWGRGSGKTGIRHEMFLLPKLQWCRKL